MSTLNTHSKYWCWSWSSSTLATWYEELTHWKRLLCWERSKAGGEEGDSGWGSWMASPMQWTWTWANSRRWWGTEKPGEWQSMGSQRIRHYLARKQQQHMPLTKELQITWNKLWQNEGKINNSTIIFEDFNTPLSIMDRTTRPKINKDVDNLNNTINQLPNRHL